MLMQIVFRATQCHGGKTKISVENEAQQNLCGLGQDSGVSIEQRDGSHKHQPLVRGFSPSAVHCVLTVQVLQNIVKLTDAHWLKIQSRKRLFQSEWSHVDVHVSNMFIFLVATPFSQPETICILSFLKKQMLFHNHHICLRQFYRELLHMDKFKNVKVCENKAHRL